MKGLGRFVSILVLLLVTSSFLLGQGEGGKPENSAGDQSLVPALSVAENTELVKGLVLTGTLKQVIGSFGSHGRPEVGDTFEIDLDDLPQRMLRLSPHAGGSPYIPFSAPLTIERVIQSGKATVPRPTVIHLSAVGTSGKLLVQVIAKGLERGSKIRIVIYKDEGEGFIGSMAEAEGVLK